MKIVFITNYFNHHQRPLSDALYRLTEGQFSFLETEPMRQERRDLGYGWDDLPAYVKNAYDSQTAKDDGICLVQDADVVIAGSVSEEYLKQRIRQGKLVLRYAERPLKDGPEPLKYLPRLLRWSLRNPRRKPVYLLAASAYAAEDYAKFGLFRNKAFRWGYFPEVKMDLPAWEKEECSILWVGRFLDWKHPDDALRAAVILRGRGLDFSLRFIGTGPMEQQLHEMTQELGLSDCVEFLGPMKPEQVRGYMERSSILLFTSDRQEGWGAVVNEAMSSGCAVIAGHEAGAVPYLIKNGENGYIYPGGDVQRMAQMTEHLLRSPEICRSLGCAARETMVRLWNAETAAQRLIELSEYLLGRTGDLPEYPEGPCTPVRNRKDNCW